VDILENIQEPRRPRLVLNVFVARMIESITEAEMILATKNVQN